MSSWTTVRIPPKPFIAVDHAGQGEHLVFMHGIGGNKRNWHDNLPAFAQHVRRETAIQGVAPRNGFHR